ncbi:MAG: patatin-like phospholipase family protein [Microscillaceae bacterium]|nr:patatin-like phospholipase family protein [Microscillaceae bacterium]
MAKNTEKHLAVALQGGGAHGAFTWGVLDRFLEEKSIILDGFVGTSAGAMNATILAYGLQIQGPEKARELLEIFWKKNSEAAAFTALQPGWYDMFFSKKGNMDYSLGFIMTELYSLYYSPYQINPTGYNPLKNILEELVDFDRLRSCTVTKLFVCATNVRRGRVKVFKLDEISVDAVLASANLPQLFHAVTIDGEDYWDGGFMGNPPIFPLIDGTQCSDIMLVQINPINIPETPKTADEIKDRVNELSFNSSLMLEMRKIEFIERLLKEGFNPNNKFRHLNIHNINPEKDIWDLNVSSKLNATWDFLMYLKNLGRQYATEWLDKNYDKIGVESTCNIRETFL